VTYGRDWDPELQQPQDHKTTTKQPQNNHNHKTTDKKTTERKQSGVGNKTTVPLDLQESRTKWELKQLERGNSPTGDEMKAFELGQLEQCQHIGELSFTGTIKSSIGMEVCAHVSEELYWYYIKGRKSTLKSIAQRAGQSLANATVRGTVTYTIDHTRSLFFASPASHLEVVGQFMIASDLSTAVIQAISDWWLGGISGINCLEQLASSTICSVSSAAGLCVGSQIGISVGEKLPYSRASSYFFSFWLSCAGYLLGKYLGKSFSEFLFGIAEDDPREVLRRAYEYMGISPDADERTVRVAYLRKALELHPDHNSNMPEEAHENFIRLQAMYEVIRVSRM